MRMGDYGPGVSVIHLHWTTRLISMSVCAAVWGTSTVSAAGPPPGDGDDRLGSLPAPPLAHLPGLEDSTPPVRPAPPPRLRDLPDPDDLPPRPSPVARSEARPRAAAPRPTAKPHPEPAPVERTPMPRARPSPPAMPKGPHASPRPRVDLSDSPYVSGTLGPATSVNAVAVPRIRGNSASVGKPNRGHLARSVQLPEAPALYELRRPDEAYGSTHALRHLLNAIGTFHARASYPRPLSIGSISKQGGGKLRPHASHQSGRDVDIRLPVADPDATVHFVPKRGEEIDWPAAWLLVRSILETEQIEYIFLDHERQQRLIEEARRDGATPEQLAAWFQYPNPRGTNNGIIRHAPGHGSHIHVRFTCSDRELRCESY